MNRTGNRATNQTINLTMNRTGCEREFDAVKALRTGALSPELRDHVLRCVICTEAQAVARVMVETSLLLGGEHALPAAGLVWRRAEARKREVAFGRATRPLVVMRGLSLVYAVLSAAWLLHYLFRSDWRELLSGWNVLRDEATCFAAGIAVLAIVMGAGYLLRDGRRSGEGVAST